MQRIFTFPAKSLKTTLVVLGAWLLVLAVGGDESAEFHRQSEAQAKAWAALSPQLIDLPGFNHYTIVDGLADKAGVLHSLATEMLRG